VTTTSSTSGVNWPHHVFLNQGFTVIDAEQAQTPTVHRRSMGLLTSSQGGVGPVGGECIWLPRSAVNPPLDSVRLSSRETAGPTRPEPAAESMHDERQERYSRTGDLERPPPGTE